jgi:hypothetical protein
MHTPVIDSSQLLMTVPGNCFIMTGYFLKFNVLAVYSLIEIIIIYKPIERQTYTKYQNNLTDLIYRFGK